MINYFDLHCDSLNRCVMEDRYLNSSSLEVNTKPIHSVEQRGQIFAIWIDKSIKQPMKFYQEAVTRALGSFQSQSFFVQQCKNSDDINEAVCNKKMIAILSIEDARLIEKDLSRIKRFYDDGVRTITLTWNHGNQIAGGAFSRKGLTKFGFSAIKEINKLNMAVDLSHLNEKSFYRVASMAKNILATHSNAYDICPHKRNLKRQQLEIIKKKDGICGICFYPEFLGGNDVFLSVLRHINYMLSIGMENNISIGSDFAGAKMSQKLFSQDDVPNLYNFLKEKGLEEKILKKIFFENAYNFYYKLLKGEDVSYV